MGFIEVNSGSHPLKNGSDSLLIIPFHIKQKKNVHHQIFIIKVTFYYYVPFVFTFISLHFTTITTRYRLLPQSCRHTDTEQWIRISVVVVVVACEQHSTIVQSGFDLPLCYIYITRYLSTMAAAVEPTDEGDRETIAKLLRLNKCNNCKTINSLSTTTTARIDDLFIY